MFSPCSRFGTQSTVSICSGASTSIRGPRRRPMKLRTWTRRPCDRRRAMAAPENLRSLRRRMAAEKRLVQRCSNFKYIVATVLWINKILRPRGQNARLPPSGGRFLTAMAAKGVSAHNPRRRARPAGRLRDRFLVRARRGGAGPSLVFLGVPGAAAPAGDRPVITGRVARLGAQPDVRHRLSFA